MPLSNVQIFLSSFNILQGYQKECLVYIFISQRISIDGINVFSIGLFFFIVQLLEKSVTAKEEMELDLFGKVRFSYFMSH